MCCGVVCMMRGWGARWQDNGAHMITRRYSAWYHEIMTRNRKQWQQCRQDLHQPALITCTTQQHNSQHCHSWLSSQQGCRLSYYRTGAEPAGSNDEESTNKLISTAKIYFISWYDDDIYSLKKPPTSKWENKSWHDLPVVESNCHPRQKAWRRRGDTGLCRH